MLISPVIEHLNIERITIHTLYIITALLPSFTKYSPSILPHAALQTAQTDE